MAQAGEKIGKTFEGSLDKFVQKMDNVRERVDALQRLANHL